MIGAERHAGRSASGNVLVNGYTNPFTGAKIPPTNRARSRTLQSSRTSQSTQKLPCAATAVFKTEKNFADRNGGCRAGKFGVGQGGLEGRETPPKGVSLRLQGLPPKSSPYLHLDFDE